MRKKALIVYKAKKTNTKVPKAKAYIITFKEPLKTPTKSLEKAIVYSELRLLTP
jgi:hypothetical protein